MVRHARALGGARLRRADVEAAIHLHRVGVHDLAAEALGELDRERRSSPTRWARSRRRRRSRGAGIRRDGSGGAAVPGVASCGRSAARSRTAAIGTATGSSVRTRRRPRNRVERVGERALLLGTAAPRPRAARSGRPRLAKKRSAASSSGSPRRARPPRPSRSCSASPRSSAERVALREQRGHGAHHDGRLAERLDLVAERLDRAPLRDAAPPAPRARARASPAASRRLARTPPGEPGSRAGSRRARAREPRAGPRAGGPPSLRAAGRCRAAARAARSSPKRKGRGAAPRLRAAASPRRTRRARPRAARLRAAAGRGPVARAGSRTSCGEAGSSCGAPRCRRLAARRASSGATAPRAARRVTRRCTARGSAKRTSHLAGCTFTSTPPAATRRNSSARRKAPTRQHVAVHLEQRVPQQAVAHGPAVHEQVDARAGRAVPVGPRDEDVEREVPGVARAYDQPLRPRARRAPRRSARTGRPPRARRSAARSSRRTSKWTRGERERGLGRATRSRGPTR